MRIFHHAAGHFDVLFECGGGLAVFLQRAIHHDAGKAQRDGAFAGFEAVAMILVHGDGNFGIKLAGGQNQMKEIAVLRKLPRAAAGLDDDRRFGFVGRAHDGLNLFHVVHVEGADAVAALGGLVEELPH